MSTRTLLVLLSTLLLASLGVGLAGMWISHTAIMHSGILGSITSATFLVCGTILHTQRTKDSDREAAIQAGYRLALQHVARGLFDPTPKGGLVLIQGRLPRQHERQAQ